MDKLEVIEKVTFKTDKCVGCHSCELACSFHHVGYFQPSIASIRVTDNLKGSRVEITFYRTGYDSHIGCDQCEGFAIPLCVQFCPCLYRDGLKQLLQMSRYSGFTGE